MPPFRYVTPVRFADVDHAGIMYYPRFFHLFHMAFEELWRTRLGARAYVELLDRDRIGFPAVHAACDFKAPLAFGDTAAIDLTVTRLGGKSIHFHYRVWNDREPPVLCADGTVICAVVDLARFTATPAPARVLDLLRDVVEPQPEPAT